MKKLWGVSKHGHKVGRETRQRDGGQERGMGEKLWEEKKRGEMVQRWNPSATSPAIFGWGKSRKILPIEKKRILNFQGNFTV